MNDELVRFIFFPNALIKIIRDYYYGRIAGQQKGLDAPRSKIKGRTTGQQPRKAEIPDNGAELPDSKAEIAVSGIEKPDNSVKTPDSRIKLPDSSAKIPDNNKSITGCLQ